MRKKLPTFSNNNQQLIGQKAGAVKQLLHSRYSVKVLFVMLMATLVWSGVFLAQLSTEYSIRQFYPKGHPLLEKDLEIRRTFGLNEKSPFLYVVTLDKGQSWLQKTHIQKLQDLTHTLQERSDINQTLSLTMVEGAQATKEELLVGNVFDRIPQPQWKNAILSNPLLYPLLITSDFRSTLVAVEPKTVVSSELQKFHPKVQALIQKQFPKAKISSAGVPLIQTRLSKMIQSELTKFLVAAVLVFCGLFYFLFSHWTAIACAFATLLASNVLALGLLAACKIPMNIVLVTLPIIVSVAVMSLLIHTLHLWSQKEASKSKDPRERWIGALETMKELGLANFLGAWTTALGFLALAPSHIPMIGQYGWVVAAVVGVMSVYGQLFILMCLPFVQPRMRAWFDSPAFWSLLPLRHFKKIVVGTLVLCVVGGVLSSKMNFSARLFDDLPQGDGVRASTEWIDQVFGGLVSYEVVLEAKKEGYWKDPLHLKKIHEVAQHLRKHPDVGSVVTISDFFQSGIPTKKETVAETFFLFSMAEKNPLSGILTENARNLRLMIRLKDRPTDQILSAKSWIQQSVQAVFPDVQIGQGGMASYAHAINLDVAHELVFGFWQSLLAIGLFLVFMFRSLRWAVLSCLPNFIPPAVLMGALALSHVSVKPGIALIFSIALGFAFNNTVYLLSRLRSLMKERETAGIPLKRALLMEANPCFFESLVMLVGFSLFIFSKFSMNQTFGAFMMISIIAGFVADLLFLPAFLKLFPGLLKSKAKSSGVNSSGDGHSSDEEDEDFDLQRAAAAVALVVLGVSVTFPAFAQTPQEVLKKSRMQLESRDDQAKVEMKIIEKNGEVKTRMIDLKTLKANGFSVMAKIQSPADIKGMGFLGQVKNGQEAQWIYLPSSGQVRRVVTGKTKGGLLGSEVSAEDLNSEAIKASSVKISKADAQFWWIEILPAKGTSTYSRVVTKLSKQDYLPQTTEYFVGNRLKKTVEFKNYAKIGSTWRAQLIDVRNHLNGRGTQIKLTHVRLNSGLKAQDFSQSALKED